MTTRRQTTRDRETVETLIFTKTDSQRQTDRGEKCINEDRVGDRDRVGSCIHEDRQQEGGTKVFLYQLLHAGSPGTPR